MKTMAVIGLIAFLAVPNASFAASKTFEECQQIAISRGILIKRAHPDRYMMLKGSGEKTKPKGFMARCMAGVPD